MAVVVTICQVLVVAVLTRHGGWWLELCSGSSMVQMLLLGHPAAYMVRAFRL